MKQILQNIKTGRTELVEVPAPLCRLGHVLIASRASLFSVGTVHYFANGSRSYPKETLEVFSEGRVIRMENFRVTRGYGFRGFSSFRTWRQDKGHRAELSAFVDLVEKGGKPLIPFPEIVNVTLANFAAVTSAREGRRIRLEKEYGELCNQ